MRALIQFAVTALLAVQLVACIDRPSPTALRNPSTDPSSALLVPLGPIEKPPIRFFPGPDDFVQISAGAFHTCARRQDGRVYCWGKNDQTETGGFSIKTCVSGWPCVDKPSKVMGITAATIDVGYNHACALDAAGKAFCWGSADRGQTGMGGYGYAGVAPVSGNKVFTSISAGKASTCGTTAAGVYCWGAISQAKTGGRGWPEPMPLTAMGDFPWAPNAAPVGAGLSNISVGYLHACAQYIVGSYRDVECWGDNKYGQAGGDPTTLPFAPVIMTQSGTSALRISSQDNYNCVEQPNLVVQCFGVGSDGQFGNGQTVNTHLPQTVSGSFYGVTTSSTHTCALNPQGYAYCWGNGYWGQLGNNNDINLSTPQAVTGGRTYRAIAAGLLHTCAIGTDNQIYCWGENHSGQLGTQYPGGWVSNPVPAIYPIY